MVTLLFLFFWYVVNAPGFIPTEIRRDTATKTDTIPPATIRRGPRPAILPGAGLDTSVTKLPAQDPAIREFVPAWLKAKMAGAPMYIINGDVATVSQLKGLNQADVVSINTMDGKRAVLRYGANAQHGLVLITTKSGINRD